MKGYAALLLLIYGVIVAAVEVDRWRHRPRNLQAKACKILEEKPRK
jgi:hypothetical protein